MSRRKVVEVPRTWTPPRKGAEPEEVPCPVAVPSDAALDDMDRSELLVLITKLEQALNTVKASLVSTLPRTEYERLQRTKLSITNERLRVQDALSRERHEQKEQEAQKQLARERAFIAAARMTLPEETYRSLWAEADRIMESA